MQGRHALQCSSPCSPSLSILRCHSIPLLHKTMHAESNDVVDVTKKKSQKHWSPWLIPSTTLILPPPSSLSIVFYKLFISYSTFNSAPSCEFVLWSPHQHLPRHTQPPTAAFFSCLLLASPCGSVVFTEVNPWTTNLEVLNVVFNCQ